MSGVEAIGVAASIIQVADLGAKLSVKLFSFYQRVRSASESIQLLSNEIALVSAILRELGDNLKEEEASKLCSKEAFRTLSLVLNQARDVLGQIQGIVDENDQKGKSRFQQMTGKLRVVYQEPSIDQLKTKLERLKSTMLLLLNVITYAGQIRSNVPNLVQEQRDLIQTLLQGQRIDHQKSPEPKTAEGPREISDFGTLNTPTDPTSYTNSDANSYHSGSKGKAKAPRDSAKLTNNRIPGPRKHDEPSELKDYNLLIRSMLVEIESCKRKLESNRHSRIKNGILNIHSGEIMRFQIEHGHSIHIDQSLFADDLEGVAFRSKTPEEIIQPQYSDSDFSETDVSIRGRDNGRDTSYRFVSRDRLRKDKSVSSHTEDRQRPPREAFLSPSAGETQGTHKKQDDIVMRQSLGRASRNDSDGKVVDGSSRRRRGSFERVRPPALANPLDPASEENQEWAYFKQEQEIERLEREIAKYRGPSSEARGRRESRLRPEEDDLSDDLDEDPVAKSEMQRRRERLERGSRREREETRRAQMLRRLKRLEERREYDTDDEGEEVNDRVQIVGKDQYRTEIEDRRSKLGQREPRTRSEEESEEDEPVISDRRWRAKKMARGGYADGKEEGFDRKTQANKYPEAVATTNGIDSSLLSHRSESDTLESDCSTVDIPDITPPRGAIQSQRYSHDVVPGKTWSEEVLLPANLEDLLAQWTTLDRDEIENGQYPTF